MRRLSNWQTRLSEYLVNHAETKFKYGVLDCGLFVADSIVALTGIDVAVPLRGQYTHRKQAFQAIRDLCGKASMGAIANYFAKQHAVPEIAVGFAQRGDPVLLKHGRRSSLGIVDMYPGYLLTPYRDGILRLPLDHAVKAFHVG